VSLFATTWAPHLSRKIRHRRDPVDEFEGQFVCWSLAVALLEISVYVIRTKTQVQMTPLPGDQRFRKNPQGLHVK
jgi:hypothetical protein